MPPAGLGRVTMAQGHPNRRHTHGIGRARSSERSSSFDGVTMYKAVKQSTGVTVRVYPLNWNVDQVARRKGRIDPKPPYQRAPVWSTSKKQLLIDTILRGYDIPKLYVRRLDSGQYEHEVVDGQQRLRAIWDYVDDKFELGEESESLPGYGDLSGKKYSGLSPSTQDDIGLFQLTVQEIQDESEEEIRDLFRRLQEGVSLSPAEKRHAMMGNLRDFIAELAGEVEGATPHSVFPLTRLSSNRYKWEDLAAHVVRLEQAGGAANVKAADLYALYESNQGFDMNGKIASKVNKVLNYMARVLKDRPPEMNIKWGFVDLYLLLSSMMDSFDLRGREQEIEAFYVGFEGERRATEDPAELLATGHDDWDRDLYDYIEAFQREGAKRSNIESRHRVYVRRLLRDLSDVVPKDPQRSFTNDERIVIWRRDNGQCQLCGNKVAFDHMHADHVIPHSAGGNTTIANAQLLCHGCNLQKGPSI